MSPRGQELCPPYAWQPPAPATSSLSTDNRWGRAGAVRSVGALANQLTTRNQRRRSVPSFAEALPDRTPRPLWGSQFGRFGPHPRASTPNCEPGSPKRTYNQSQMARRWSRRGSNGKCRIIDRTFPLDAIADAHRYMESNRQLGKIVVTVS